MRALGEMSSGVAQDFNNQLTVLIGYSDLLLLNNGQMVGNRPMAVRYLQTLRTAAQESAKIVGRLKEFSRRREAEDVFLPINLPKLVREMAELTQPKWRNQARADGVQIAVRLELEPVPDVPGNAAELREVVTHLIFNAVDAMPGGGTITLRTRAADGRHGDAGGGRHGHRHDDEVRRAAWSRFSRPRTTRRARAWGSPRFTASSSGTKGTAGNPQPRPGDGTTVRVRLPVQQRAAAQGQAHPRRTPARPQPLRVLLVEEDPMVREVVSEYLRRDEHEVSTAVTGTEGLEKFEAGTFDLVVTDLALDGINGERLAAASQAARRGDAGDPADRVRRFARMAPATSRRHRRRVAQAARALADLWRAMAQVMTARADPVPAA